LDCGWGILALLLFYLRLDFEWQKRKCAKISVGWRGVICCMSARNCHVGKLLVAYNDLHASDGRDTEALNCKPITNL